MPAAPSVLNLRRWLAMFPLAELRKEPHWEDHSEGELMWSDMGCLYFFFDAKGHVTWDEQSY